MAAMAVHAVMATAADQVSIDDGSGGTIKEKLRATEFEFSRSETDVHFLGVLSIYATAYGKSEFLRPDGSGDRIEFRSINEGAYALVPLHIGRRDIVGAVPCVSYTQFRSQTEEIDGRGVTAFYLPVGGACQSDSGRQWGGFAMPCFYSPFADDGKWATDFMAGAVGRSFSGDSAVWYYGLVYDRSFGADAFYPYLGYTFQWDRHWLLSLVMPWPTISYAPNDRFLVRAGALPAGATWKLKGEGSNTQAIGSVGGWDIGIYTSTRVSRLLWLDIGAGFSGLRSLRIENSGELTFEQNLSREPFFSVALSLVPN